MLIIDNILFAPLRDIIFLGNKINEIIEQELSDEGAIKEQLMELQLKFELDEIDEKEYDMQEEELLNRLEQIRGGEQSITNDIK
jgi:hypothetical protein